MEPDVEESGRVVRCLGYRQTEDGRATRIWFLVRVGDRYEERSLPLLALSGPERFSS